EDIFEQLDDSDLNKLDDATVRLRWTTALSPRPELSLHQLVGERIRAALGRMSEAGGWSYIVDDAAWRGRSEAAWRYLASLTMDRPREILKLLRYCQLFEETPKLTPEAARLALAEYSAWLYREIGNEIYRELPEYRNALGILTRIGGNQFTLDSWRSEFGKDENLNSKYRPDQILEQLFDFSVAGVKRGGTRYFKHGHPQMMFDKGALFCVHPGLGKHLHLSTSRRRTRDPTRSS